MTNEMRMPGFKLSKLASASMAGIVLLALAAYFYEMEGYVSNAVFIGAFSGAVIAALTLLTRRLLFSTVFYASIVTIIAVTAYVKFEALTFALHAWDFFYYAQSWALVAEWWRGRPVAIAILVAGFLSLFIGSWMAWRMERAWIARRFSALAIAATVAVAWIAVSVRGERMHMQFNFPDWHITSFFVSLREASDAWRRGGLIEAAPASNAKPFDANWSCAPRTRPPHIILIHQESIGPPMFFPQIKYDPVILPLFNSFDGQLHKMNVETFGGASWLTESAILIGLSSRYFGTMKDFIQFFMAGRLKEALPQVLEKCGYRNVMFYPYIFGTFGNRNFFESIGIREVYDRKAQGAALDWDKDRFYYTNMLGEIGKHVEVSQKPLFIFLQTMSAHWPYNYTFEPDIKVPGSELGNHPEMNEYLRRLTMARHDLDFLKDELRKRFPGEQFLLVQYGDHHALPMSYLYGYTSETGVQDMTLPQGFPLYTTYYSVDGINYTPPRLPAIESVDASFVGAILLDSARLPVPESWRERLRLMQLCEGLAWQCKQREEMLKFHRRLIESGMMQTR